MRDTDNEINSASGGATIISPSSWTNHNLSNIFSTAYTKPINKYYPYVLKSTNSSQPRTETTSSSSPMPVWVRAIIGVFTGLGCMLLGLAAWYLNRWRQQRRQSIVAANTIPSAIRKESQDIYTPTEETNTNYSTTPITPVTGVSSMSREKEQEASNTQISVGTAMSQADSVPVFELDCKYISDYISQLNSDHNQHARGNGWSCRQTSAK